eukprot:m.10652 g.10652  ORF g.10652 m.10652 type:complete len:71 (-) comp6656_c0_seq1:96-308(-)
MNTQLDIVFSLFILFIVHTKLNGLVSGVMLKAVEGFPLKCTQRQPSTDCVCINGTVATAIAAIPSVVDDW